MKNSNFIKYKTLVLASFFLLLVCSFSFANLSFYNADDLKSLDQYFAQLYRNDKAIGSIEIQQKSQVFYQNSFGYANIKKRLKSDSNTIYPIGSITKTYTAVIIMQLVEEGKLTLATKLKKFKSKMPGSNRVSIEDLLLHQSTYSDKNYFNWKYRSKPMKFTKKGVYANVNYGLLGEIIEELDKKSLSESFKDRIITPLKLINTSIDFDSLQQFNLATPYVFHKKWISKEIVNTKDAGAAGALVSSAHDNNVFLSAMFSNQLLSPNSLKQLTDMSTGRGMGLFPAQYLNYKGYTNSGQFADYHSVFVHFPSQGLSITICFNGLNTSINKVLKDVVELVMK